MTWPVGDSEMAGWVRRFDWSSTALGPASLWPQSLRSAVDLILPNGFPAIVLWGPDLIQIYNDGYRDIMGVKHPGGLGQPNSVCWPEVWSINEPIYRRVFEGETLSFEEALYPLAASGRIENSWLTLTYSPIRDEAGIIAGVLVVLLDVTQRHRAEVARQISDQRLRRVAKALRSNRNRLVTVIENIPQLVWRADEGGRWTWISPQWKRYTGLSTRASIGKAWLGAIHPDDRAVAERAMRMADEKGVLSVELRVRDGATAEFRWFQARATQIRDAEGMVVEWLGTFTDVHEARAMQERQKLLMAELQHRTRNLLGVVQAIAVKTAAGTRSFGDFIRLYRDRLGALSRINGFLSRLEQGQRITLDGILRMELGALGLDETVRSGRIMLHGPADVRLRSASVQTFALAVHELFTNAMKYGALSGDDGRLTLTWWVSPSTDGPGMLNLEWQESILAAQNPAGAQPPGDGGFGQELLERALPYQMGAQTSYRRTADSVFCSICLPLA